MSRQREDIEDDSDDPTSVFYNPMAHEPFTRCSCPTCKQSQTHGDEDFFDAENLFEEEEDTE